MVLFPADVVKERDELAIRVLTVYLYHSNYKLVFISKLHVCTKQLHITNALDYFNYDGVWGDDLASSSHPLTNVLRYINR